jgi:hypothetical protein
MYIAVKIHSSFEKQNRIHGEVVHLRLSLDSLLVCKPLCLFTVDSADPSTQESSDEIVIALSAHALILSRNT